jgi:hypothetical protein
LGNDGGVYRTANFTSGNAVWGQLNNSLSLTQFSRGPALNPGDIDIALAGTQDNGTLRYGNPLWNWSTCGDGGAVVIDPLVPGNIHPHTGPLKTGHFYLGLTADKVS